MILVRNLFNDATSKQPTQRADSKTSIPFSQRCLVAIVWLKLVYWLFKRGSRFSHFTMIFLSYKLKDRPFFSLCITGRIPTPRSFSYKKITILLGSRFYMSANAPPPTPVINLWGSLFFYTIAGF